MPFYVRITSRVNLVPRFSLLPVCLSLANSLARSLGTVSRESWERGWFRMQELSLLFFKTEESFHKISRGSSRHMLHLFSILLRYNWPKSSEVDIRCGFQKKSHSKFHLFRLKAAIFNMPHLRSKSPKT